MFANHSGIRRRVCFWLTVPALLTGCDASFWKPKQEPTARPSGTMDDLASFSPARRSPAIEGTVGEVTYVRGWTRLSLRGYGLVVGLAGTGSRNCMPSVREYLMGELRRERSADPHGKADLDPEALIDSLDTAVVEVWGDVPRGAAKRRTFDVFVSALSVDPDTRSLAGGYLLPCELKIFAEVSPAKIIEGRTHGKAQGPVFINPFVSTGEGASDVNLREGRVIGGGVNLIDRRLSLVTANESYSIVQQVTSAINRRFNTSRKVADGTTATHADLNIPDEFQGREERFLDLVLHLPLSVSPAQHEERAKALVGELARPDAPWERVALALEGIGPRVLPMVQQLYADPRHQVSYYAGRVGLRLGDNLAIEVVIRHANDPRSPFRVPAIRELGECQMRARAGAALRELLGDSDVRIRIRAYEALRSVDPESLVSTVVGRAPGNFILELVPAAGPALVYARRTGVRRVALIGVDQMIVQPPLLYTEAGKPVTLSAREGDRAITVRRKEGGQLIGEFKVPLSAASLTQFLGADPRLGRDGKPEGLGLEYGAVLDVLYHLCENKAIRADLKWEEPSVEDIVGPLEPLGRPESEL